MQIGSRYKVVFTDNGDVNFKIGIVLDYDSVFVTLKTNRGEESLPVAKVIRTELLNGFLFSEGKKLREEQHASREVRAAFNKKEDEGD